MFSIWSYQAEMDGDMILQVSPTVCAQKEHLLGLYERQRDPLNKVCKQNDVSYPKFNTA